MSLARDVAVTLFALFLLALYPETRAGHLETIQQRGELVLLCFPNMRTHHAYVDLEKIEGLGKPLAEIQDPEVFLGVEVDLVKKFAEELGVGLKIRAITTSYGDLLQALRDGEGDLVASSLTITEAREKVVDFSIPHTFGWISVVVPGESSIARWEELQGLRVAVLEGSSQMEYLRRRGLENFEVIPTEFSFENLAMVEEGEADFALMDTHVAPGESPDPTSPGLKVAFHLEEFGYGMALPEGSDLRPLLNAFLQRQIDAGELDRLVAQYRRKSPRAFTTEGQQP
jgi:polar amino acid transport system substrate-binding protein